MDCSPLGSSVSGIIPARILEWVAFPSPGNLHDPGIKPTSPTLQVESLPLSHLGNPTLVSYMDTKGTGSFLLLRWLLVAVISLLLFFLKKVLEYNCLIAFCSFLLYSSRISCMHNYIVIVKWISCMYNYIPSAFRFPPNLGHQGGQRGWMIWEIGIDI